jgi:H+/Cl- antiporter ClcA
LGFLLWKFLANVVSYPSGIPGGLFLPSLSIGAAFAPLLSVLPDVDPQACALLGMGAYLAGVTRSPLAALDACNTLFNGFDHGFFDTINRLA